MVPKAIHSRIAWSFGIAINEMPLANSDAVAAELACYQSTRHVTSTAKGPALLVSLRNILTIKSFQTSHRIHKRDASLFVKAFSSTLLQICTRDNGRFKDYWITNR